MNNLLIEFDTYDAYMQPLSCLIVLDSTEDNVQFKDMLYTVSENAIKSIKTILDNNALYEDHNILPTPVLDGTEHKIVLNNKKTINCSNLWYFDDPEAFENADANEEDIKYTKLITDTLNNVLDILEDEGIEFDIPEEEYEEEEYEE